ncbi:MAG TPA: response regulator [Polyangiaceae bacterium]|nr:response regulator [Polyangiaceae bacterium]
MSLDTLALLADLARAFDDPDAGAVSAALREVLARHGLTRAEDAPDPVRPAVLALISGAARRVSDREELLRARERAQMLSEASFEGIMINVDGAIIDANQRLADMLGYEPHELLGPQTMERCVAPEDQPMVRERMRERVEGDYVITGVRKNGSRFRAEILTKQGKLGGRSVRVSAVRDVTERERTHALLRENEARLRELAQTAFDLVVYSRDGVMIDAFGNFERPLGRSREELVGKRIIDFVAPESRADTLSHLEGQTSGSYVSAGVNGAGEIVPLEVVGVTTTLDGVPTRLSGLRDLREARRAEAERREFDAHLEQTQRLESLGVLAGGIAHDFNNLLVGIIGGAELLALGNLAPEDRESVRAILDAGQRAATLTSQLLAYAGQHDLGRREPIDVGALVNELRRLLAPNLSKKARLEVNVERGASVLGNRATVLQVLMNLLTNASDALGAEAGVIRVRAERVAAPGERFRHALGALVEELHGPFTLIQVEDTGVGMDEPTKRRIFEPFFSTKKKGHGLGLAACLGIVSGHGGAIHVESAPGRGSTFSVLLPATDGGPAVPDETPGTGSGRVLVVDDEQVVRRQVRRILEKHGYVVLEAQDGRSALAELERERVDLVVLDVTMPELDGTEVVLEARARGHAMPIVLVSGYADFPLETRLERGMYSDFLPKPFALADLLAAVERALSS